MGPVQEITVLVGNRENPISRFVFGERGVMPYWGWIGLLLSLTAMVGGAWYFIGYGNPLFLIVTVIAGLFAYRLSR